MREIKFRGKEKFSHTWVYGYYIADADMGCYIRMDTGDSFLVLPETIGEFTGHQLNGVDIYEGDVIRVEEDAPDVDEDDKMNWYVVVFVQEWCMFAMLHTKNEYFQYLKDGKAELDEFLFWTFPISADKEMDNEKYFLCGNIHDNKELLSQ